MCLAEFAATFVASYRPKDADTATDTDVLPPTDVQTSKPTQITLTNGYGKMNHRKNQAIIRFHSYNKDTNSSNWFRAKLMLYLPWYNESTYLLGGYATYEEHYNHVRRIIEHNESKYTQANVDSMEVDENDLSEHVWNQLAPNTESSRAQSLAEGVEPLTEMSEQDLADNANLFTASTSGSLHVRFEGAANKQEIPPDEYKSLVWPQKPQS